MKKLVLKKDVVARIGNESMNQLKGGSGYTINEPVTCGHTCNLDSSCAMHETCNKEETCVTCDAQCHSLINTAATCAVGNTCYGICNTATTCWTTGY